MKICGMAIAVMLAFSAFSWAAMPTSHHVFLVVEENHSYSSVIGNPSMPYLNSLASKYGLATKYYANTHPSIGNYFMLTTGQVVTNDDSFNGVINVDDIVTHLLTAGKTWKSYAESLPSVGYTGGNAYPYLKRHNPFSYFSDVVNSGQKQNLVPFTEFASDLANNQLPNFSFIVPNVLNDAHDGTLAQADLWLSQNIAPLLASATFNTDGILILVFDESTTSDNQGGGGHVAALVIGPEVKPGYRSTFTYQHPSTLKSLLQALGLTSFPGAAQNAADMGDFFQPPPPPPSPDFTLSVSPAVITVKSGQSGASSLALSSVNGFNGAVAFSCSGLPEHAACTFSPGSVQLSQPTNVALSISTTTATRSSLRPWGVAFAFWAPLGGLVIAGKRWRTPKRTILLFLVLGMSLAVIQFGCGGSSNTSGSPPSGGGIGTPSSQSSTPAGTYDLTVVATSGSLQHSAAVELIVQ